MGTFEKKDSHKKRTPMSAEDKLERDLKDCMHCKFFWGHNYTFFEGKLYYRENSEMAQVEVSQTAEERIRGLDEIRQITRDLIDIQMEGCEEEELADKQKLLNTRYDKFVSQYGYITSKANKIAFRDDSDYPLLCSLEEVNEDGEVKKADMFYKQTIKAKAVIDRVETAVEALNVSVNEFGFVNIPYMLSIYEPDISEAKTKIILPSC